MLTIDKDSWIIWPGKKKMAKTQIHGRMMNQYNKQQIIMHGGMNKMPPILTNKITEKKLKEMEQVQIQCQCKEQEVQIIKIST